MAVELKWLGHASFRIAGADGVAYIDPWKLADAPHDADVIVVSHSHFDHCSPDDVKKVSKADTAVIAPADTIARLGARNAVAPGESVTIKDITVETVAAYNVNKAFHPRGNNWLGVVITIDGKRIYYAGDTDLIPEMSDLADIDLALLPVGGTYTLNAAEAVNAAPPSAASTPCPTIGATSSARPTTPASSSRTPPARATFSPPARR